MNVTFLFPKSFVRAESKLRSKFQSVNAQLIKESIQYASAEYWIQKKNLEIDGEDAALGWFLKVAHYYLYKELERVKHQCDLLEAQMLCSPEDFEGHFIERDLVDVILKKVPQSIQSTLYAHASGLTLAEIARCQNVSLSSIKKRHSRTYRLLRRSYAHLYYAESIGVLR